MKSISLSRWICIGFSALLIAISFLVGCQSSTASSATSASAASSASSADVETAVTFSVESGAYQAQSIDLTLSSSSGLPIVYTTDGSLPTASSVRFDGAISIDSSDTNRALITRLNNEIPDFRAIVVDDSLPTATVIRAAVLRPDGTVGPTFTNTYFVDEDLVQMFDSIMVVSLVVDPANLLDYESGIMAKGAIYDEHREENEQLQDYELHLMQVRQTTLKKAAIGSEKPPSNSSTVPTRFRTKRLAEYACADVCRAYMRRRASTCISRIRMGPKRWNTRCSAISQRHQTGIQ